jgi:ubiquinone/menaquinone biosynthesis C-methylase UbiE
MNRRTVQTWIAIGLLVGLSRPVVGQLAPRSAEEWIRTLESPTRVASLKIEETIAKLRLKPGENVADIGSGSGVFVAPLARAVYSSTRVGKIYAVDIDQALLDKIERKKVEYGLSNVMTVLGGYTDPKLPAADIDLAFINDVLHHIENRAGYLKALARYIRPAGRIAVIDFYPERGGHRDQPALQVTKQQTADWLAAAGFKPIEEHDLFTDKWFVVYGR